MSESSKRPASAPRLTIEQDASAEQPESGATEARERSRGTGAAEKGGRAGGARFQHATEGFFRELGAWMLAVADAHPHTVLYGGIGLLLAILILAVGLWDTIVLAIFTGVGAAIGQMRDGESGVVDFFSRLFGGNRR